MRESDSRGGRRIVGRPGLTAWIALLCSLAAMRSVPAAAAPGPEFDLLGTWYVLVHYRDAATDDPEAERWADRLWVFARKGSRLAWTEYPSVVFMDERGRFERTLSGEQSRVLAAWEPNERQRAEIRKGLEAVALGSKTKTLRGSPSKGFKSVGGLRTQSVSVIGYHSTWSIEGLSGAPSFSHADLMGSGRTENMEWRTQYSGVEVLEGGALVRGNYAKDGTISGVFRMMRAADLVKSRHKKDRGTKRPYQTVFASAADKRAIDALVSRGDAMSDDERQQLRVLLRETVSRTLDTYGLEGQALELRSESLSRQVEQLLLGGGTVDEVEGMAREGMIRP